MAITQPPPVYIHAAPPRLTHQPITRKWQLYIIAMESGTVHEKHTQYYVGISTKSQKRLEQHIGTALHEGKYSGAKWCEGKKVYPHFLELSAPIHVDGLSTDEIRSDVEQLEDLVTAQMLLFFGLNRVRGGKLTNSKKYTYDNIRFVKKLLVDVLQLDELSVDIWVEQQLAQEPYAYTQIPNVSVTPEWFVVINGMYLPPGSFEPLPYNPRLVQWPVTVTQTERWNYLKFGADNCTPVNSENVATSVVNNTTSESSTTNMGPSATLWFVTLLCVLCVSSIVHAIAAYVPSVTIILTTAPWPAPVTFLVLSFVTAAFSILLREHWSCLLISMVCAFVSSVTLSFGTSRMPVGLGAGYAPFFYTVSLAAGSTVMLLLHLVAWKIFGVDWFPVCGTLIAIVVLSLICMLGDVNSGRLQLTYGLRVQYLIALLVPTLLCSFPAWYFVLDYPDYTLLCCPAAIIPAFLVSPMRLCLTGSYFKRYPLRSFLTVTD